MVAVLTAGNQVPVILLVDDVGNIGAGAPWHTFEIGVKVGTIDGEVTVTDNVFVIAH